MKDKKDKRKHHESTIGKIIYGFLLFAPLLAIAVTCSYAIFNKNAYQSYSGEIEKVESQSITEYLSNETIERTQYKTGYYKVEIDKIQKEFYNVHKNINNNIVTDFIFNIEKFSINNIPNNNIKAISFSYANNNTTFVNTFSINFTENTNIQTQYRWEENSNTYTSQNINTNINSVNIKFKVNSVFVYSSFPITLEKFKFIDFLYTNIPYYDNTLTNIFYNSINQVEESNLFNWSKNTAIYTVLNNTSNTLGITNTFWPMLMAYWLIISVIYILYDIVLMMLVIFHRKIHCLQDSI